MYQIHNHKLIHNLNQTNTKQDKQSQNRTSKLKTKIEKERTKETQQANWSIEWEDSQEENEDTLSVPLHFKKYTMANQKIVLKKLIREIPQDKISYDLPELSKTINLAQPREEPKPVQTAQDLTMKEETLLLQTLTEYRDVFAWYYKDLKGVDPNICQHIIPMKLDAKPINSVLTHTTKPLQNQGRDRQTHRSQLHLQDRAYKMGVTYCGSPQEKW